MNDYQDLIKKLAQINEGASIVSLDVSVASNDDQQLKSVMVGLTLSSGSTASMTIQAPCFETLLDSLETLFSVQGQIVEQAIEQVNVMASTGDAEPEMDDMAMAPTEMEPMGDDEYSFSIGDGEEGVGDEMEPTDMEPGMEDDQLADDDVVIDPDSMEPEAGEDVDTDEARYSHQYSFRNKGTGLFQSLTGQQRISKGALKAAKRRLGK
ncbi:MAG: hypothetical protein M0R77_02265 [Gammaproteobacteria bacterium]|nr:hypothetical protein [Gammaproteobacteria bacterium]